MFDSNYLHCYKSALVSIVPSSDIGEATHVIEVANTKQDVKDILKEGNVLFFDSDGNVEKVRYINRVKTPNGLAFHAVSAPEKEYSSGTVVGIPESFFTHGVFNLDNSDIQNGLFSFDTLFISDRLNSTLLFQNKAFIDVKYMAVRILTNDGKVEEAEYLTAARIKNSVSGLRGFRFNENNYIASDPVTFIVQDFKYEDFTPEQLDLLVGPQGPKGDMLTTATMAVTYIDDTTGVTMARLDDVYDSITLPTLLLTVFC